MSETPGNNYSNFNISGQANVHAGNNYITLPTRPRPTPRSLVPQFFGRDKNFVGREDIIEEIDRKLTDDDYHRRVALTGLGGIGKSQIALEYASRYAKQHSERWVFWVSASSKARFIQDMQDLAASAGISSSSNSTEVLNAVRRWLNDTANGKWLMIVDNADSSAVLFDVDSDLGRSLSSIVPRSAHGAVVVASRNDVGKNLAGDVQQVLHVGALPLGHATRLLTSRLSSATATQQNYVQKLATKLDCIPLAISQASAYICQTRVNIKDYLETLSKNEDTQIQLLGHDWRDIQREEGLPNAVLTTWMLTLRQLKATCAPACRLLGTLVFFDCASLSETFVYATGRNDIRYQEAVGHLLEYSLIGTRDEQAASYSMHRLVQVCTRAWLRTLGTFLEARERAVLQLGAKLRGHYWCDKARGLDIIDAMPHVKRILAEPAPYDSTHAYTALLCYSFDQAMYAGQFSRAVDIGTKAFHYRRTQDGHYSFLTLLSWYDICQAYLRSDRFIEAETGLNGLIGVLQAMEDIDSPTAFVGPGSFLLTQAITLLTTIRERRGQEIQSIISMLSQPGRNHGRDQDALHDIALAEAFLYNNDDKAVEILERHLQSPSQTRTEDAYDYIETGILLGLYKGYMNTGRFKDSEDMRERAYQTQSLGPVGSPITRIQKHYYLGILRDREGRYEEAVLSLEQALALLEEEGPRSPMDATPIQLGLAQLHKKMGTRQ